MTAGSPSSITDSRGGFFLRGLANGTYDVVPSFSGYGFTPPGTTVTFYCWNGMTISDQLGNAIEQGKLLPEQFRVTYYPGDRIPNYTLTQPMTLHVNKETPGVRVITVKQPTSLAQLLRPGMGAVHWAACRESLEGKTGWVDLLEPGQMPKH